MVQLHSLWVLKICNQLTSLLSFVKIIITRYNLPNKLLRFKKNYFTELCSFKVLLNTNLLEFWIPSQGSLPLKQLLNKIFGSILTKG